MRRIILTETSYNVNEIPIAHVASIQSITGDNGRALNIITVHSNPDTIEYSTDQMIQIRDNYLVGSFDLITVD